MVETAPTKFVDAWIYTFHMPLFFVISGFFLLQSARTNSWSTFIYDKLCTIAYPYFVWSVITVIVKVPLETIVNEPLHFSDLESIFYRPIDQFWFLYALFFILLAFSMLLKLRMKPWFVLAVAVLFYSIPMSPAVQWGAYYEIQTYAIYVAIGLVVASYKEPGSLSGTSVAWLILLLALGSVISSLGGQPTLPERTRT